MSELEIELGRLIQFCIWWKGEDPKYEESLKTETVKDILQLFQQERVKAQEEAYDKFFQAIDKEFKSYKIDVEMGRILNKLKQSLGEKKT